MNILTDVLSLIRRKVFAEKAYPEDVIILGVNEEPDMLGIASPIPYKSIKVIKVKDFKIASEHCNYSNSPSAFTAGLGRVYQKTSIDPVTSACTVYFRSLKSMSTNLTFATSTDDSYVEVTTTGEPNTAANVGAGVGVWKNKVGETLNFKSLKSSDASVVITSLDNEIDFTTAASALTSVGLIMPSAFTVTNTPITTTGSLTVVGAGTASQIILGDGTLGSMPAQGVMSITGSTGITVSGTSPIPVIAITYDGVANAIEIAPIETALGEDYIWFSDTTDSNIKKTLISNFPGYGLDGTVTSITPQANSVDGTSITSTGVLNFVGQGSVTTSISGTTVTITGTSSGTVTSVAASFAGTAFTATVTDEAADASIAITANGASTDYVNGLGNYIPFPTIPALYSPWVAEGDNQSPAVPISITSAFTLRFRGTAESGGAGIATDSAINTNQITIGLINTGGTADATTFYRGDGQWAIPAGSGNLTAITEGEGISITNSTGPIPNVAVDYTGLDNVIHVRQTVTPFVKDYILFHDLTDDTVYKSTFDVLPGYYAGWDLTGDFGAAESIISSSSVLITGGTGVNTVTSSSDTLTINLDTQGSLVAGSYVNPDITVNAQGIITAATSSAHVGPIGYFSFNQSSTVNSNFTSDLTGISITNISAGLWSMSWVTALSNTDYIVNVSSNDLNGVAQVWAHTKTTQGFRVSAANGSGTLTDMLVNMVIYK